MNDNDNFFNPLSSIIQEETGLDKEEADMLGVALYEEGDNPTPRQRKFRPPKQEEKDDFFKKLETNFASVFTEEITKEDKKDNSKFFRKIKNLL